MRRCLDGGADLPRTPMLGNTLGAEVNSGMGIIGANEHTLAHQAPRDGVLVAIEANAEAGSDGVAVEIVGVERT
jgi:hypothetical protein